MTSAKLYAVVGNPVAHSKSPQMQNAAFEALRIDAVYFRILAENAQEAMDAALQIGASGLNITSPFKEEVACLVDKKSPEAKLLNACNTVIFENGKSKGYNTDPDGVIGALLGRGAMIKGKKAVVLGAGGAARAAVLALTKNGANVVCANRTVEKAREIAQAFGCEACGASREELETALRGAEILVSCVTTHGRIVPTEFLTPQMVVLDANYSSQSTIVSDANGAGCKLADPLSWLLFQGTAAFEKFTGKKAPLEAMRNATFATCPDARKRRKIALIGFMGAGKSTVGKTLSEKSGLSFVETDDLIVRDAGKQITKIFEDDGEGKFREMEASALEEACGKKRGRGNACKPPENSSAIISCGGGIVLREENAALLHKECFVVWLLAGMKETFERIKDDKSRPLLNRPDREEAGKRILDARLHIYAKTCHVMINTEGKSPQKIAEMIMNEAGITK